MVCTKSELELAENMHHGAHGCWYVMWYVKGGMEDGEANKEQGKSGGEMGERRVRTMLPTYAFFVCPIGKEKKNKRQGCDASFRRNRLQKKKKKKFLCLHMMRLLRLAHWSWKHKITTRTEQRQRSRTKKEENHAKAIYSLSLKSHTNCTDFTVDTMSPF